jgi:hypothetical protein
MELVFVRIKVCQYSDAAEPFVNQFAESNNLTLTKYSSPDNDIPKKFDKKQYPILYFVENNEILGFVKGFSSFDKQLLMYVNELKYIKNPELRPLEPIITNEEKLEA